MDQGQNRPKRATGVVSVVLALIAGMVVFASFVIVCSGASASDVLPRGPQGHALVMVDDPSCVYCARWRRDVGPGYAKSAEGRYAPLSIVQRSSPYGRSMAGVRYTPTFVLLDEVGEVGRIVGYGGEDSFWSQLQGILFKAGFRSEQEPSVEPSQRETRLRIDAGRNRARGASDTSVLR